MKLIKQILAKTNVREVLNKVVASNGTPGIDDMPVEEVSDYMNGN